MAEAGLPEFLEYAWAPWAGIYAPKGTSPAIVEQINRDLNRVNRAAEREATIAFSAALLALTIRHL